MYCIRLFGVNCNTKRFQLSCIGIDYQPCCKPWHALPRFQGEACKNNTDSEHGFDLCTWEIASKQQVWMLVAFLDFDHPMHMFNHLHEHSKPRHPFGYPILTLTGVCYIDVLIQRKVIFFIWRQQNYSAAGQHNAICCSHSQGLYVSQIYNYNANFF